MTIQAVGFKAYSDAMANFSKAHKAMQAKPMEPPHAERASFSQTLSGSLGKVNDLQVEKGKMVAAFASGENQNVHELMISLQKAGLAINLTSAVRSKMMEAYKELSKMQF